MTSPTHTLTVHLNTSTPPLTSQVDLQALSLSPSEYLETLRRDFYNYSSNHAVVGDLLLDPKAVACITIEPVSGPNKTAVSVISHDMFASTATFDLNNVTTIYDVTLRDGRHFESSSVFGFTDKTDTDIISFRVAPDSPLHIYTSPDNVGRYGYTESWFALKHREYVTFTIPAGTRIYGVAVNEGKSVYDSMVMDHDFTSDNNSNSNSNIDLFYCPDLGDFRTVYRSYQDNKWFRYLPFDPSLDAPYIEKALAK